MVRRDQLQNRNIRGEFLGRDSLARVGRDNLRNGQPDLRPNVVRSGEIANRARGVLSGTAVRGVTRSFGAAGGANSGGRIIRQERCDFGSPVPAQDPHPGKHPVAVRDFGDGPEASRIPLPAEPGRRVIAAFRIPGDQPRFDRTDHHGAPVEFHDPDAPDSFGKLFDIDPDSPLAVRDDGLSVADSGIDFPQFRQYLLLFFFTPDPEGPLGIRLFFLVHRDADPQVDGNGFLAAEPGLVLPAERDDAVLDRTGGTVADDFPLFGIDIPRPELSVPVFGLELPQHRLRLAPRVGIFVPQPRLVLALLFGLLVAERELLFALELVPELRLRVALVLRLFVPERGIVRRRPDPEIGPIPPVFFPAYLNLLFAPRFNILSYCVRPV